MRDVLLVDDDGEMVQSLARALRLLIDPLTLAGAGSPEKALEVVVGERPRVAVIDLSIDQRRGIESGFALLRELRQRDETLRIIVLTGHGSTENGVRALREGAASFIEKPADPHHLAALIRDGAAQAELKRRFLELSRRESEEIERSLVGESRAAEEIREQIRFAASTNQPVLILGETGTGKGLAAKLIHEHSRRKDRKFVQYHPNFGGGDLVHSELFGHTKGSFTGAGETRKGLALDAHEGSLFLDELDEFPLETQVKLLDLIQEKRIRPVGSDSFQIVDCRIIAATNKPMAEALATGKLRRDLYHRIAHLTFTLPALRERMQDLSLLCENILRRVREKGDINVFEIASSAMAKLERHAWPGNIRELQGVLETAAYFAHFKGRAVITDSDIRLEGQQAAESEEGSFTERVQNFKLRLIREALARCNGNQLQAANDLGIDRGTLRRLMGRAE